MVRTIQAEVFASLPAGWSRAGQPTRIGHLVDPSLGSFLEGPDFGPDGRLYCVDVIFGRIFAIDGSGTFQLIADYDGEPNGLKVRRDGTLVVVDRRLGIVSVDPATGAVSAETEHHRFEPFRGLNDLSVAASGTIYFTDQGMSDLADPYGRVLRRSLDGATEVLLDGLAGPNGIAVDATEHRLYIAITRTNSIVRASIGESGLARVSTYLHLSGGGGPDGIALTADGGLAVARPESGVVQLFDHRGELAVTVELAIGNRGTNLVFGGPGLTSLYITESDSATIQVAETGVAGLPHTLDF
jgi:gluconolactonase